MARVLVIAAVLATCVFGSNVSTLCADTTYTGNLYRDITSRGCGQDCQSTYCACIGWKWTFGTPGQCVIGKTPQCLQMQNCLRNRIACLNNYALSNNVTTTPAPTDNSLPPALPPPAPGVPPPPVFTPGPTEGQISADCARASNPLRAALLVMSVGTTPYSGSALEGSCRRTLCDDIIGITNMYRNCPNATGGDSINDYAVCRKDIVRPATPLVLTQIRLTGPGIENAFVTDARAVKRALQSDVSKKVGVDTDFVDITKISIGSLIVDMRIFGVDQHSAPLLAAMNSITVLDFTTLSTVTGITLTSMTTVLNQRTDPGDDDQCGGACVFGLIIGGVVIICMLVGGIVAVALNKKKNPMDRTVKIEPKPPVDEAAASTEPTAEAGSTSPRTAVSSAQVRSSSKSYTRIRPDGGSRSASRTNVANPIMAGAAAATPNDSPSQMPLDFDAVVAVDAAPVTLDEPSSTPAADTQPEGEAAAVAEATAPAPVEAAEPVEDKAPAAPVAEEPSPSPSLKRKASAKERKLQALREQKERELEALRKQMESIEEGEEDEEAEEPKE